MKHVLSVIVNNHAGVLSHVTGLFTRRSYNIESLCVGETNDQSRSVITLVIDEDDAMVRQIEKQLYKLMDVIEIRDLTGEKAVKRELLLVTVKTTRRNRHEVLSLAGVFLATVVDMTDNQITIELVANPRRISHFIDSLREYEVVDMARTGTVALAYPE